MTKKCNDKSWCSHPQGASKKKKRDFVNIEDKIPALLCVRHHCFRFLSHSSCKTSLLILLQPKELSVVLI